MVKKRRRFLSWIKWLVIIGIVGVVTAVGGFFVYGNYAWGDFDQSLLESYDQSTFLYDANDDLYRSMHRTENRINIEIESLPEMVKNAFIAAEDLRFYQHFGIDPIRMASALLHDIKTMSLSHGASTITQQLVKLTHLTLERSWERKLKEIYYAIQVERVYSKDEILEMYLNYVNFGNGAYGIEAAAQKYFGVSAKDLTLVQVASLAASIKAPSNYAPHLNPERNKERREYIINTMLDNEMISQKEAQTALNTPIVLSDAPSREGYEWFTDEAISQALEILDVDQSDLSTGGYRIYTTLNPDAQKACDAAAADTDLMPDDMNGEMAQCAIVLMAKDGAVEAITGGREYTAQKALSRATSSLRQPGSAIKPLAVYAPAIELLGTRTVTYFNDAPMDFNGYSPGNYGGKYNGYVTLRTAFEKSLNIPAVTLMDQIGVHASREYLSRFGIPLDKDDIYLPLALGAMTYGVSPYRLCAAYLGIIGQGYRAEAYLIRRIEDSAGNVLYEHETQLNYTMTPSTAYLVADMMQSTASKGSASRLSALGYPIGAKTGTVGYENIGNRDAWCVAVTPEHAIAVWVGFDQTTQQTHLPNSVSGSNVPAQTILAVLGDYLPDGDGDFSVPSDVVQLTIDGKTLGETGEAYLATDITPDAFKVTEVFSVANRPHAYSPFWQVPNAPYDVKVASGTNQLPLVSFTTASESARYLIYRTQEGQTNWVGTVQNYAPGTVAYFLDESAERGKTYAYHVVAQHALAADYGVQNANSGASISVAYQVPGWSLPDWFQWWGESDSPEDTTEGLDVFQTQ